MQNSYDSEKITLNEIELSTRFHLGCHQNQVTSCNRGLSINDISSFFMNFWPLHSAQKYRFSLLICTLKRDFEGCTWDTSMLPSWKKKSEPEFFQRGHLSFVLIYGINPAFFWVETLEKIRVCRTWKIWNKLWFIKSEIRLQIKRLLKAKIDSWQDVT